LESAFFLEPAEFIKFQSEQLLCGADIPARDPTHVEEIPKKKGSWNPTLTSQKARR
jgi:hypothetical protein